MMSVVAQGSPGIAALQQNGVRLPVVVVGPDGPRTVTAQIDTGSTMTSVDVRVLGAVGAQVVGHTAIITPDGQATAVNEYAVKITTTGGFALSDHLPYVLGDSLSGGIQALIGRDILDLYTMIYEGPAGSWQLDTSGHVPAGKGGLPWWGWASVGVALGGVGVSVWGLVSVEHEERQLRRIQREIGRRS